MNLRQLECFRAVMISGTMTRAGELLRISQPSVSNMITSLEREIGFSLFRRRKGRLQPTAEAVYFFEQAEKTLESLEQTMQVAYEVRNKNSGRLVVAAQPGLAFYILPKVISEFHASHPNVRVKILNRSSHIIRDMVPRQQFDIGISEPPVEHPAVKTAPISVECVCILPANHPLADEEVITPRHLDGVPFISLFSEHFTYFKLANAFARARANWNVIVETYFFSTCCALVKAGVGVSICDPHTALNQADESLVLRRFKPTIEYEMVLMHAQDRPNSQIRGSFTEILNKYLAEYVNAIDRV